MHSDVARPSAAGDLEPGDVFWNIGRDGTELCIALLYEAETPTSMHVPIIAIGHELNMMVGRNDELPSPLSRLESCKIVIWEETLCASYRYDLAHRVEGLLVNAEGIWMCLNDNLWFDFEHGKLVRDAPATPWLAYSQASITHGERTLASMGAGRWQLNPRKQE